MPFAKSPHRADALRRIAVLAELPVGAWLTRHVSASTNLASPERWVHVVAYKFRDATSLNDQEPGHCRNQGHAAKIPGIRISG